jgi:ABC-type transport system substrate-binding protein
LWRRIYFPLSRFKHWRFRHWKPVSIIAGFLILLALLAFRIMSPEPGIGVQIARSPVLLDPARTSSYEEKLINSALYETLVAYDPEKNVSKGVLADRWDVSQGGSVYTFYLHKGRRFHDGTQVTAQDIKTSWERVLDPAVGNCGYLLKNVAGSDERAGGTAKNVSGLVVIDQYTFRVVLKEPDWTFPAVASSPSLAIISQKTAASHGAGYGKTSASVAGTGPFRLASWDKDKLVLKRNTKYAGSRPHLKTLTFTVVSRPQEVIRLYNAGRLDVLAGATAQTLSSLSEKDGQNGFTTFKKPVLTLYFLGFNIKQAPFDKSGLRQAIGLAIDGSAVEQQFLGDGGKPLSGFVPPELYSPAQPGAEQVQRGPDQALQALAAAGYPYGLDLPSMSYGYNDSPGHDYLAHLLQEQLGKVGIELQLKKTPWQDYQASIRSGSYTFFRLGWEADYAEPGNLLHFNFDSTEKHRNNLTGYSNSGFDALLQQARSEQDPARRQELYRRAEEMMLADAPVIPLFQQVALFGLRKGVAGFDVDLLGRVDFERLAKS